MAGKISFQEAQKENFNTWWCNVHKRAANYFDEQTGRFICDPKLAGITMPCSVEYLPIEKIINQERINTLNPSLSLSLVPSLGIDYFPDRKMSMTAANDYYHYWFYCSNCNERNPFLIKKGIRINTIEKFILCRKCSCNII